MNYEPLQPDRHYHIFNRGNNGENIFIEEKNYTHFLSLLQKHLPPVAEIHAYCLLKNHFHLLIRTKDHTNEKQISQVFSNFFNAYAKSLNKAYNRTGSLFQTRFSRILIKEEKYLVKIILYIHLNPKKHGFTDDFSSYKYSSFPDFFSKRKTWVAREDVLNLFGGAENFKFVHFSRQAEIDGGEEYFLE